METMAESLGTEEEVLVWEVEDSLEEEAEEPLWDKSLRKEEVIAEPRLRRNLP
jgi:hypothetical protein